MTNAIIILILALLLSLGSSFLGQSILSKVFLSTGIILAIGILRKERKNNDG